MLSQWLKWAPPNHSQPTLKALSDALQSSGHECLAVNLALSYAQRKGEDGLLSAELESLKHFTIMLSDFLFLS